MPAPSETSSPRLLLYKLLPADAWNDSLAEIPWAPVDHADGFMHLSTASQVRETARRHFGEHAEVVLITIDADKVESGALRWEPSRGGEDFPHVYGKVTRGAVVGVDQLARGPGSVWVFPPTVPGAE